jgi:hypothetical protein
MDRSMAVVYSTTCFKQTEEQTAPPSNGLRTWLKRLLKRA